MRGLSNKVALITGSGRGLGRGIAERLVSEGSTVVVNDRDANLAQRTAEELNNNGQPGQAYAAPADVSDYEAIETAISEVEETTGPIEILVNNAGMNRVGWFLKEEPSEWSDLMEVNLLGQIYCARAVAERMVETETPGTIIGVTSDAGRNGAMAQAVYSSTKAGIIGFTKSLARELSRYGITANAVAPGPAKTEGVEELMDEQDLVKSIFESIENHIPLGRIVRSEDIAGTVAFLASDDASYITGQVISVSGGLTMND